MHLEAHAAVGWTLALVPRWTDRRLRIACLAAATIPDIDAGTYLFGDEAYLTWHHTFGHNLLLGVLVLAATIALERRRPPGRLAVEGLLVTLAFGSHLLSDAWFTRFPLHLWWPFQGPTYLIPGGVELDHWSNRLLLYVGAGSIIPCALWRKVTPLEVFWPRLDRIVVSVLKPRDLRCATCDRPSNLRCDECGAPTCLGEGHLARGFRIRCRGCRAS